MGREGKGGNWMEVCEYGGVEGWRDVCKYGCICERSTGRTTGEF